LLHGLQLNLQGQGQYTKAIKNVEEDIQSIIKRVNELAGIKESDTGLAPPALWDLAADKQNLANEQPLQVSLRICCDLPIKSTNLIFPL
jgi:26S proteasome regulatory subunit T1